MTLAEEHVLNERTSFATWANAFESSRLVIGLKWTSNQKVDYLFVMFKWDWRRLRKDSTSHWIVLECNLNFLRKIDLTAWLWGWNVRVNGMRSKFSFSAAVLLAIDQFVGRSGGLPERQKQDSHVYRKTGTLPLIFRKNQSRHCEVWETVKKVWNSCRVMNANMNTASNYVNLLVCSKHWCTDRCPQLNFWCLYSRHYINDEVWESV